MAKGPGGIFQEEVGRSLPPLASPVRSATVWGYKFPDPATWFGGDNEAPGSNTRFSPKYPFDFLVTAPAAGCFCPSAPLGISPQIVFALECKRTQGRIAAKTGDLAARLAFDQVKDHQVAGLLKAAAAGNVAGVLWLVELPDGSEAECHFLRIGLWEAYKASAKMRSMPLSYARHVAVRVHQDVGRGSRLRYWRMRELMIHYGADVEPTPKRKKTGDPPRPPRQGSLLGGVA